MYYKIISVLKILNLKIICACYKIKIMINVLFVEVVQFKYHLIYVKRVKNWIKIYYQQVLY